MKAKTLDALWDVYKARRVRGKKTEAEIIRQYERYVQPTLGAKRLNKITFEVIDNLHQDMRGAPYQANRVLALLRTMFRYAGPDSLRWMDNNPARGVRQFPERKRQRHMRRAEAPRIATEITKLERYKPRYALFMWLLIFTGARPAELKRATWDDLDGNVITLKDHKSVEKTGLDRTIVIPPAGMSKLDILMPAAKRFPGQRITPVNSMQKPWGRLRVAAGCPDLRLYDLRHTFGSYALQQGYNLDQIGEALAHQSPTTTKIYAELTTRTRNRMALDSSLAILYDMGIGEYVPTIKELT